MNELYKKYRPKKFKDVLGIPDVTKTLQNKIKNKTLPHSILFVGPSGCGKTTLARIIARKLNCGKNDYYEINCADFRGIEMVRSIRSKMGQSPIDGSCRIWVIDECHKLSNDAQNAFLKILEDTPSHVYFIMATTDPHKLINTIKTRCTQMTVKNLGKKEIIKLITETAKKEKIKISEEVLDKLIETSEGSARKVLVLLDQISELKNEDDQLSIIGDLESKELSKTLAKALLNPRTKWNDISKILRDIQGEDAEGIRRMILGYANAVMIKNPKMAGRCYLIIDSFRDHCFDCGFAGLSANCYEVLNGGN